MNLVLVGAALACPVCFRGGGNPDAYLWATAIMMVLPVTVVAIVARAVYRAAAAPPPGDDEPERHPEPL